MQKNYNTDNGKTQGRILYYKPYPEELKKKKLHPISIILRVILILLIIGSVVLLATAKAEDTERWVLCQPGNRVNLRLGPSKGTQCVGWLEPGDKFYTDGTSRNGWLRVTDAGECVCWIYSGYAVEEEPEAVFEARTVVARKQVACRRWVNGPQIQGRKWLKNGREVQVFYVAEGWAVTNLGYIEAEWLEV